MLPVSDPPFLGDWVREKKLGAGGFGFVTLWKNSKTEQRVAVKQCHPSVAANTAEAQSQHDTIRKRWLSEVTYMVSDKLRHANIVRGLDDAALAPFREALEQHRLNSMPVLLMEYCEGGDLRRLLNTSEYACGFPDHETRDVLRSLGAAIQYMHSKGLTHRDIKPENIVFTTTEGGQRVYKLTDLGYVKALDHQTLVASLVGTLEYIAPELCISNKYTCTVDYWSMGIIAYEIVTGVRPFVPHLPLARWMVVVKGKKSEHIAIVEDNVTDAVHYVSRLPDEHKLSGTFADALVPWLRLALEWNPKQRGHVREPPTNAANATANPSDTLPPKLELRIFKQLKIILDQRILRVFCLHTYRPLSIAVPAVGSAAMRVPQLIAWIAEQTSIPEEYVVLVLPVAHPWHDELNVSMTTDQLWWPDHDGPMLYVYRQQPFVDAIRPTAVELPDVVRRVLAASTAAAAVGTSSSSTSPSPKWRPHVVRHFGTAALHICRREQRHYRDALAGWHSLALRLNHNVQTEERQLEQQQRLVYRLDGLLAMLADTLKQLLSTSEAKAAATSSPAINEEIDGIVSDCTALEARTRTTLQAWLKIVRRFKSLQRRSQEACHWRLLERRATSSGGAVDVYGVERADKQLEILRYQLQQKTSTEAQLRELVHTVEQCQRKRAELLNEKEWLRLQELPAMANEFLEIQKAINEKTVACVDNLVAQALKLNARLFACTQKQAGFAMAARVTEEGVRTAPTSLHKDSNGDAGGLRFQIGSAVSEQITAIKLATVDASNGLNTTASLIHSNRELLSQMEDMMLSLQSELVYANAE